MVESRSPPSLMDLLSLFDPLTQSEPRASVSHRLVSLSLSLRFHLHPMFDTVPLCLSPPHGEFLLLGTLRMTIAAAWASRSHFRAQTQPQVEGPTPKRLCHTNQIWRATP